MKILVNALSGIGDALMFSPALSNIKERYPDAKIDILVMYKSVEELYSRNPKVDKLYFIDFFKRSKFKSLIEVLKIRKNKYDYSINVYPSNRLEYNLLNFLLGARTRISFKYLHTGKLRFEGLNNVLLEEVSYRHNVLQNLEIAKIITENENITAGKMEIFLDDIAEERASNWFIKNNINDKYLIGLHPGSSTLKNHINKRWEKDKYILLIKKLISDFNANILLFGNEFELNNEIFTIIRKNIYVASTNNFQDSLSRLKRCNLFVTNDTAYLHCASAFQIPVVAIFAYTNHLELHPWNTEHIVVRKKLDCSPCFYNSPKPVECLWTGEEKFKCIKGITVDEVYEACKKLIKKIPYNSKS